ncbi:hypothetical protein OTU49_016055 [Cherax quadricarinatus]|uniref:Uncharacterized protein n=1 Tax=Cherax quadricarinatus TaxID=27406 RepID=A0AAW0Y8H3_CHEQU
MFRQCELCHERRLSNRLITQQHNQVVPGGSAVNYVELPLSRDAQPGYQVSATELCLFAAKRKNVYLSASSNNNSTTAAAATLPTPSTSLVTPSSSQRPVSEDVLDDSNIYTAVSPVRDSDMAPATEPHIYATGERRGTSIPVSSQAYWPSTSTPVYATLDHRRSAYIPSSAAMLASTTMARPRSVTNIPTADSTPVSSNNAYATLGPRRRGNINTTSNSYISSLHRLSLHSPPDYRQEYGVTAQTPLLATRISPSRTRSPITTSRSPLLRMANESAV